MVYSVVNNNKQVTGVNMAGQYEFVDFAKEDASRLKAQTEAAKGAFEFAAEKKAYAEKQAESKGIYDILRQGMEGQGKPAEPQKPSDPFSSGKEEGGGYDPKTGAMAGQPSMADQLRAGAQQQQGFTKEAVTLQRLMLNAAKNNDPEGALKFKTQLDGLADKMADSQSKQLKVAKDLYEVQGQLSNAYLANPTDEQWNETVREAMRLGIPGAEQMLTVPRDKREAVAKAGAAQALTANQSIVAAGKQAALAQKEKHQQDLLDLKGKELILKQRRVADQRNIAAARLALDKTKLSDAEKKTAFDQANKAHKSSLDTLKFFENKDQKLDALIKDYEKGNILGLDEKETAAKLSELRSEKADNQREIDAARSDLSESDAILEKAKTGGKETKAAVTVTSKAEYDKLQPGDKYIWNGVEHTKGK